MSDTEQLDAVADEPRATTGDHAARIELIAIIVMSLTAILTAWTGFQSAKWSGVQSINFSEASANRTESVRAANLASTQRSVDVGLFVAWAEAIATENTRLSDFLIERFPQRLRVATDAWLATEPLRNPDAPGTPFEMDEYVVDAALAADRLEQDAEASSRAARRANQRADNYVLTTVLFALVLFLGALASKLSAQRNRALLLGFAVLALLTGLVVLATYPVEI